MSQTTNRRKRYGLRSLRRALDFDPAPSLAPMPDDADKEALAFSGGIKFTPFSDLDLMIKNGWGNTRQCNLPKDWRTRHNLRRGGGRETRTAAT